MPPGSYTYVYTEACTICDVNISTECMLRAAVMSNLAWFINLTHKLYMCVVVESITYMDVVNFKLILSIIIMFLNCCFFFFF